MNWSPDLWPHQIRGLNELAQAIDAGERRLCLTSPTGGGKTRLMCELIHWAKDRGWPVALYTHRKLLTEQLHGVLESQGIEHGVRASGWKPRLLDDVQLCSVQTDAKRTGKTWERHNAKLVLIDEAHVNQAEGVQKIIKEHDAVTVGFTATPIDLGHIYDRLIVAGTNTELRECGAHVIAQTFGPDEPDTRKIKPQATGEYSYKDVRKVIMTPTIFGRVFEWWKKLNPNARPALLFAPGVKESIWFAEQFVKRGVRAAHIDGDDIWLDGQQYASSQEGRADILAESQAGRLPVICNRFVLREGIDAPWLYHGIFATVFGSLQSFVQSGGRLLRAHPSMDHVVIQDHGGSWYRHGSLNADRQWHMDRKEAVEIGLREERLREKKEPEPIVCVKCKKVRASGPKCPACGYEHTGKSRMVVQLDGSLKEYKGDIFKPRRVETRTNTDKLWNSMYFRAKKSGMTFRQAEALFFVENHYYPPRTLDKQPVSDLDWFRKVSDVPGDQLRQVVFAGRK